MNWLSANWIWILVGLVFVALHLFGHGGHRGHGRKRAVKVVINHIVRRKAKPWPLPLPRIKLRRMFTNAGGRAEVRCNNSV